MSCEIKSRAIINDLTKVKRILFPLSEAEDDQWSDDAWQWKVDYEEIEESSKTTENWMQGCFVCCSPHFEVFVLAHEDRWAVLTSKWEKNNDKEVLKYHLAYPTSSSTSGLGEEITSVLCLPINSLQKSSQGQPDWMCVILGFNTGYVRMYTVDGKLLMTEAFQDEPVQQLRFRSSSANTAQQEFLILYQKVVIVIESLGLFNSLRACRNFLAKGQALYGAGDLASQHPPLHYKKFSLQDQSKINECYVLGTSAPCQFDHLVTASIAGGFNARYNLSPPVATGILSLGSQPYIAWHFAIEGSAAPLLTDVAYALASKVTSKIFSKTSGWLGWGGNAKAESGPSKPKEKQINEPATPVYPKFGLADALREAISICVSPNERLAAVTDTLGRVILIDLQRGIAVRFWKGYRDAQCGWVVASETSAEHPSSSTSDPSANRRTVAFLVIYIPKRGLMEVWTTQQGTRVAAFNCCKGARLLNMGGRSIIDKDLPQCCLLCPNGKIDEIIVPFHCALKGDSSQKARDLHVLDKFRHQLNTANVANFELLLEIKHASVVSQGFDMLIEHRLSFDPNQFIKCLESVVEQYIKAEALNAESRLLLSRCRLLSRLIRVYVLLKDIQSQPPDYDTATTNASSVSVQEIATLLSLNIEEVSRAIQPRNQFSSKSTDAGTLPLPSMELHAFLRAFDLCIGHGSADDSIRLSMKSSVATAERSSEALGGWIWGTCFARSLDLTDKLALALKESLIVPEDLINLLISFWLNLNQPALPKMVHFHKVFRTLCCLFSPEKFNNSDTPNPLWQNVQELLCKSNNLEQACSAALVGRSVIAEFEKRKILLQLQPEKGADSDDSVMEVSSLSDWEDMSIDMVQWNVLSKQLEDLTYLSRLIKYKPVKHKSVQRSVLDYLIEETPNELSFTLSSILQKGRGSVTELVARWYTQNLLEFDVLFDHKTVDEDESMSDSDKLPENAPEADSLHVESSEEIIILKGLFNDLNQHLPNSTQHDVVLLSVAVEYAAMWIKNPKCMKLLERSLDTVLPLQSNLLRHGICRTLWSMSLSPIFHDLSVLMDKTGRLPKSFTSRKINLPSTDQVIPFLKITMKLLDTTITSAMSCETEPPPHIRYDDIWPTCEGATPMLEVAIRQRLINIDLVLLHHQLAQVLFLMASLEVKGVHAFSLFDQRVGRFAFFKELHTYPPLPSQQADPTVSLNRLHFLKQVIIKSVEMMEQNQTIALDFVNQSVKLGYEWGVDVDELRIKYVELLYLNDFDHLANEMLPSIASDEKLASTLLNTVGKRLKPLLQPRDTSGLSPMTVAWLDGFDVDMIAIETIPKSRSTNTLSLLVEVLHRLPSDCNDRFIANEIRSLLTSM